MALSLLFLRYHLANGQCIWMGHSHQEGAHMKNLAYNGPPQLLEDPEAIAIFKRRCPNLYNEYAGVDPENPDGKYLK